MPLEGEVGKPILGVQKVPTTGAIPLQVQITRLVRTTVLFTCSSLRVGNAVL